MNYYHDFTMILISLIKVFSICSVLCMHLLVYSCSNVYSHIVVCEIMIVCAWLVSSWPCDWPSANVCCVWQLHVSTLKLPHHTSASTPPWVAMRFCPLLPLIGIYHDKLVTLFLYKMDEEKFYCVYNYIEIFSWLNSPSIEMATSVWSKNSSC